MSYTLTRQNRKTIGIYIKNGGVEVRAPLGMSQREIARFVDSKRAWIDAALAKEQLRLQQRAAFALHYGDAIPYRGQAYPIAPRPGRRVGFDGSFYMPPELSGEEIMAACVQIYRLLAKELLREKSLYFAEKMQVTPHNIKVNGAKTRWGSCSAQGSLNFSWRLVMADDAVIDYVVVHELAHLRELNHSPRFWAVVAAELPDYKQRQQQLKALQRRLAVQRWD